MEDSHLFVDQIEKSAFVWHERDWVHSNEFHSHQKAQLVYVTEGFQYLYTENSRFLLPQNHAAWIPSNVSHKTSSNAATVFLRTIYYDTNHLPSFFDEFKLFTVSEVLREMILYTEKWSKLEVYSEAEFHFLQAILLELPSFTKEAPPLYIPIPKNPNLIGITNYVNERFNESWDIQSIATKFHFSTRTLERLFKVETGITIAKYVQLVRMIKAVELLNQNQFTISEIAYKVGYKNIQSFSNSFYQLLGSRPKDFINY